MSEMGNPQGKVTDFEHGWVAGFFDGEGSVGFNVFPRRGKAWPRTDPRCIIKATDEPSCERMHDILARAGIGHHIAWAQPGGFRHDGTQYRRAWTITVSGLKRCEAFLQWLEPLMATKRARAALVLEYIASRRSHANPKALPTDAEVVLVQRVRALNERQPITMPELSEREAHFHARRVWAGTRSAEAQRARRLSELPSTT